MEWKYFKEATFINNGEMNDPEISYKGETFNYYLVEDTIYSMFKEFIEESKEEDIADNEENFSKFCEMNQDLIKSILDDLIEKNKISEESK